ncbi:PREDICTED: uncharacterized protein LOC105365651 [Ceratosolen solmsi marchali]|uniref:Uncharacterized protein LOC105365651 n=1 Tax=Ceratosolen solmsi marchali TaxID=326594 RepID=A0AAJ7DZJ6_9HYME|nr:PREDICTED: uncharacterized protein LOC105365651 [Ceratosolen solmsi marchali]XP_011502171.1 PREDICTED: uncharacterized protein LOC105365651 [Ceratosolen solmsi marchali]
MEAKQFYNRSISPLVTKTFACKWSEDNRLSVVTEKGVHIFEVIPAPMQTNPILKLSRSFIYTSEALPGEIYMKNILDEIFEWKKEDIYSFLMHDYYTPNFPKALKMTPEIVDVFWSPKNLLHSHKCLLAIVTSAGAVELALEVDQNWISIFDFVSLWAPAINEELKIEKGKTKVDAGCLKMQLNRLIVTTVTWSPIYSEFSDSCFAYLVTAHRNSEIVIWKIHRVINDIISIDVKINVELKLKKKLTNESIKINNLLWIHLNQQNYLLIIGFFNGQIGALKLQTLENEIAFESYSVSYDEADNIPVDFIHVLEKTDLFIKLVVIKGMYLLILTLDFHGKMINTKFISSPGFSITGVSVVNTDLILITTQDGNFYAVQKSHCEQKLICIPIKIDLLKNPVQYLGLANSPNKLLFTLVTSPSTMYDHLIHRDPSFIWFLSLFNVASLNPLDIMYQEKSLLNCWDCLELIKINALKYNDLQQILSDVEFNMESLSLHKLRIAYWIMIINENLKKKNFVEDTFKLSEEIEQAKSYIFLHSASNYLNQLALQENLNETQTLSMNLLRSHLEIWFAGEEDEEETQLSQYIKQTLESTKQFNLMKQENCNLCKDKIVEPWASSCSMGHELPRCAITRLQITCIKFRICVVCQEIFHPCLNIEMNDVRCLFCDLPAIYKNQLTNLSLQTSKKNLSKKQVAMIQNKDSKDD